MRRISAGQTRRKKDITSIQVVILLSAFLNLNFKSVLGRSAALAGLGQPQQQLNEGLAATATGEGSDVYSGQTSGGFVHYDDEFNGHFSPAKQSYESDSELRQKDKLAGPHDGSLKNWLHQRMQEQVKYMHVQGILHKNS